MIERLWCSVCGHGVDGELGSVCGVCLDRNRGDGCGTLKIPEQAVADKLEMAKAVKLARKANEVRGQKTMEERLAEMKSSLLSDIRKEFDLVPKTSKEVVVPKVTVKDKDVVASLTKTKTKSKK